MRTISCATISSAAISTAAMIVCAAGLAVAGPAAAMQADKYAAPISVTTGTVMYRATATFSDGTSADRLYRVMLDPDSDGDGLDDYVWLRVACSDGAVTSAYTVRAPRDAATGQSSGKRSEAEVNLDVARGVATGVAAGTTTVRSPRDSASGLATGKRQHGSITIIKEWDRSAITGQRVSWDIKEAKGAKTMAMDDWHQRTIRDGAANLCV